MQQQQRTTTLQQKIDIASALAMFPAITVMVFIRRKLGYRFLSPIRYQVMTLLIVALGAFTTVTDRAAGGAIIVFALVMFVLATLERSQRWRAIKNGESWHTYSRGIPLLSVLPLPETTVKRFADPAAVVIIGLLLAIPFRFLGFYIIFSGICLYIFESADYQRSINLMLDQFDNLVESEVVSENMQFYTESASGERPVEQTAGISTGTDPGIAAAINRRRNRTSAALTQNQLPPDNLATN